MAYNSNKGPQHSGDIQYEGDPNDVQIDFENDQIILRTGGAPRVNVTNSEISGSGVFRIAGAISGSGDMAITGAIHATEYYGDGSNLTGIAGAASGSARLYSSTGIETSGYLKVSGSSILSGAISGSSGVHISGSMPKLAIGSNTATTLQSGMLTIRPDDTNNRVLMMVQRTEASDNRIVLAASGSSQVIVGGAHLGGVFNISGSDIETLMSIKADAGEMLSVSALNCLSGAGVARLETVSASADVYVTGAVKANVFFGDGSNLTGISSGDVSGSARVYSVTGLETSGYLKVSGSTTLGGTLSSSATISSVGSISSSTDIAVTGAIHAANFYGDGSGLTNLPAGSVSGSVRHYSSVGLETSGYLKVSGSATLGGPTSISAPLTLAAPLSSSATISSVGSISSSADLAVSGNIHASAYYGDGSGLTNLPAGSVSGSARHYSTTGLETSGYLKVSGSSTLNAVTATTYSGSSTLQTVGNALFGGTIGASGSVTLKVDEPTIHFSSSTANLGTIGFNSSNNILIQNNFTNKHIVFKANDNGTLREGFRIDGAIPEVVVNQGSDSLIDFRVESDNNANMLYVQGSTDKVGINTSAPAETFSVVGNISGSGTLQSVGSISSSANIAVTGAIHANTYYGDGSNLTGISGGGSVSGSARHYSSTGLETSGYLKVSGSTTLGGTVRSAGMTHFTAHGYNSTSTQETFIPFIDDLEATAGTYRQQMIAPMPGRLLKVWLRSKNAQGGNVTVKLYKASDGTEDFNAGKTEVEAVTATMTDANTSYAFTLSGSSPQYSAGEIVGVSVKPNANGGDWNVTCIWEYDDTAL